MKISEQSGFYTSLPLKLKEIVGFQGVLSLGIPNTYLFGKKPENNFFKYFIYWLLYSKS